LPEVVVPARPGLTNALGCLVADLRQDFVHTINTPLDTLDTLDMALVAETLRAQRTDGERINAAEQSEIVETIVTHGADMQFRGQTHLIRIALPSADVTREAVQQLFEEAYYERFRVRLPEIRAVLVNLVTSVIGRRQDFSVAALGGSTRKRKERGDERPSRRVYHEGAWREAHVIERELLSAGDTVSGPAVIQQFDSTTIVEPDSVVVVDAVGNLRIRVGAAA
jgi:N-methylhydantoinase A